MIRRLARQLARHPLWVLAGIALITVFFGVFAPRVEFLTETKKMLPRDNPVVRRFEETKDTFGSQSMVMVAMAAPEGGTVFNLDTLKKLYAITAELEKLEDEKLLEDVMSPANMDIVQGTELTLVVGPILPHPPETEDDVATFRKKILGESQLVGSFVLEDGSAFAIMLKVHPETEGNQVKIDELMKRVNQITSRYRGPEEFYVTGDAPLMYYMNLYMRKDLGFLLPVVILVVLGVLFLSFRSLWGVALPLVVVLVAVVWTLGLMVLCGVKLTMISIFLPVLLVAVGSAYGIHVVNDYFERAARGKRSREELIAEVVEEMANPVFATALTTAAGFLTLLSAFLPSIREFGLFSAVGVLFSFLLSLTLIPAVLALIPIPKSVRRASGASWLKRTGDRLAQFMDRRGSWVVLVLGVVVFGAFLLQIPGLNVESDMSKYFRQSCPVIQGQGFVEDHFGGSVQMSVVIDAGKRDGIKDPNVLKFMDALQEYMKGSDIVGSTSSLVDLVKETNYTLHGDDEAFYVVPDTSRAVAQVLLLYEMGGGEVLKSMVTRDFSQAQITATVRSVGTGKFEAFLRDVHEFIARELPPGVTSYTTGTPEVYVELSNKIVSTQIVSVFTSLGAVGLIVAGLMGSAVAGLIALTPLIISVVGNFGTMALAGANLDMATVMIASVVVGVGVDYAVHFITRYRRERLKGRSHGEALGITYNTAGRAILYNALTLTLGFLVLLLSNFGAIATLGWLTALTMVTSSLGALLIIPAIFGLAGPKFLTRKATVVRQGRGFRLAWQTADPASADRAERNQEGGKKCQT